MKSKPLNPRLPRPYNQMTAEELDAEVEIIATLRRVLSDTLSYSISPPFERSRLPHGVAQPRRGSRYRCNTVLSSRTRSLRSASFTRVGFLGADR